MVRLSFCCFCMKEPLRFPIPVLFVFVLFVSRISPFRSDCKVSDRNVINVFFPHRDTGKPILHVSLLSSEFDSHVMLLLNNVFKVM